MYCQIAPGEAIEARIIASRPWVCVFPDGHPLSQQDLIRMTDLRQEKLVGFSPGMSLRDDIDRIFVSSNLTPNYAISAQTIESICALVAAGCGIAVIHPYARHVAQMRGLATAELNHREQLDLSVVTQQKAQRARFTDQFVEIVERKLSQPGT